MNPLEQLKDIHVPPQVSAWPPAYGWWLVALVCILAAAVITFVLMKRRRFNSAKREALIELSQISSEQTDWPIRINTLLKRVCLRYFPNEQAANLHTSQWQDFLSGQLPESKQASFNTAFSTFQSQLYRPDAPNADDFQQIHTQVNVWLKSAKFTAKRSSPATGAAHV
ncbi:DUF4381 domain-containing protein [Paraglaciecola chathamensis]|uniref:DUF4381 domain-containing protein n=1 Tax=Paraglaciecola chathamensis TaxID=368405 RepID=UPI00270184A9|nr:DUF4381 domain-containing protein [Paraglaciecola chathamensis]MDO6838361.1 DUF4381 domain-containing protein [Paraglaciecola chathamensis]